MRIKESKALGVALITVIYIAAAAIGVLIFRLTPGYHVFFRIFLADTAATIFVFIMGLILSNSSVYDPYWSAAPLFIIPAMMIYYGVYSLGAVILLAVVGYWGIRLTANWAYTFSNLKKQDWRYDYLKHKSGRFFQIVNFFGIHYIPTLVVFGAMLPAVAYIEAGGAVNIGTVLGCLLCAGAAALQTAADVQMHRFRRTAAKGTLIRSGLWRYSRHPNYLGEILMWWGVFVVLFSVSPSKWFLLIGALANTLLFLFISIPLADGRYKREKTGYETYYRETRMLLPIKKRVKPVQESKEY